MRTDGDAAILWRVLTVDISAFFASLGATLFVLALPGCGGTDVVPVGDGAENIRMLALGYVQFAASNQGVGPSDEDALTKFLMKSKRLSQEDVQERFISPRDRQPYEVFWGQRPNGSGPIGPNPSSPRIIIFERTGADGTRYVADGMVGVRQLSASQFAEAVPDAKNAGK